MARVPELNVYIDKTPLSPGVFLDSLALESFKSDMKADILTDVLVVKEKTFFEGLRKTRRKGLRIDGNEAAFWEGKANFTVKLGMDDSYQRKFGVGVVTIKKGENLLCFTMVCELTFFAKIFEEILVMTKGLEWPE
jgi:hypothetical protein